MVLIDRVRGDNFLLIGIISELNGVKKLVR
jgi:hypothetical protein